MSNGSAGSKRKDSGSPNSTEFTVPKGPNSGSTHAKRQKITLSCTECRRRKVKCDHGKPICNNCIKKNLQDSCTYSTSPWIEIISNENQIYEEIEYLKRENDLLTKNIALLKEQTNAFKVQDPQGAVKDIPKKDFLRLNTDLIRSLDAELIEFPPKYKSPLSPMMTLKVNTDEKYKGLFINKLLREFLPSCEVIEYHIRFYFQSNYHKALNLAVEQEVFNDFHKIFNPTKNTIRIDPKNEIHDYLKLSTILSILKITSVYKDTPFKDPQNKLLLYIDAALGFGAVISRSSIPSLQAIVLLNSYKLFVNDANEMDLYFLTQLTQDFAIALGLHKNVDILYHDKSDQEREVLKVLWECVQTE